MTQDFKEIITGSTPLDIAAQLWEAYEKVKADPFVRLEKYKAFDADKNGEYQAFLNLDRIDDFHRCYQVMQSVRNSGATQIGNLGNQMLEHAYGRLGLRSIREYKLGENTKRRAIDLFLPDRRAYFSITTTPRERKKGDWQHELDQLQACSKLGQISDWTFVGFMYEGSKTEPKRIEDELRRVSSRAHVVMAKDIDGHAAFIQNLLTEAA